MADISNKALIYLLVIVVVISLGGTFISLNRISKISPAITGFGTTGIANLSVLSAMSISVTGNIDFGSGRVNDTISSELQSNDSDTASTDQNGTWDWPSVMYFKILNDGNTNVSINTSSNASAVDFIGGTLPYFEFALSQEEIGTTEACTNTSESHAWQTMNNTANKTICVNFDYTDAYDEANLSIRIVVPGDAERTQKSSTVRFFAYAVP